jgi:hypothetical protein
MVERAALRRGGGWILGLGTAALAVVLLVAGGPAGAANGGGKGLWKYLDGKPSPARPDTRPAVKPQKFAAFELDRAGMAGLLETAPAETAPVTTNTGLVISLPDPSGDFQAFAIEESPVMEPGLGPSIRRSRPTRAAGSTTPPRRSGST